MGQSGNTCVRTKAGIVVKEVRKRGSHRQGRNEIRFFLLTQMPFLLSVAESLWEADFRIELGNQEHRGHLMLLVGQRAPQDSVGSSGLLNRFLDMFACLYKAHKSETQRHTAQGYKVILVDWTRDIGESGTRHWKFLKSSRDLAR